MEVSNVSARLHSEIFDLMGDPLLRKHLLLCPNETSDATTFRFYVRHFIKGTIEPIGEEIRIELSRKYPV